MRYPVILAGSLGWRHCQPCRSRRSQRRRRWPTSNRCRNRRFRACSRGSARPVSIPAASTASGARTSAAALERFQQTHQLQVTGQLNQATAATPGSRPECTGRHPVTALAPPPPPADHLLPASVRAVQARLRTLGFYGGPVDGIWGDGTRIAIENLQRGRGLQSDGQLGLATITAMGLAPEALAYR